MKTLKLWIARDKDGGLWLHYEEPRCSDTGIWYSLRSSMPIPDSEYPEITFENSPQQVELKLIEEDELTT